MKKTFFFFWLLGNILFAGMVQAASSTLPQNLFHDDTDAWDCVLEPLTQVEQYVSSHQLTHTQLKQQNHPHLTALFDTYSVEGILFDPENPGEQFMAVPGFIWGFCCSFVGVLIVNLMIDDSEAASRESARAVSGCIASCLLTGCVIILIPLIYGAY